MEKVTVDSSPVFHAGSELRFGKLTLLLGENGKGKTALCEWLTGSTGHPSGFERWSGRDVSLRLSIFTPERKEHLVSFNNDELSEKYDGRQAQGVDFILKTIYVSDRVINRSCGDVEFLSKVWNIHPFAVPQVLRAMCSSKYGFVHSCHLSRSSRQGDADSADDGVENSVYIAIGDNVEPLPFAALSSREQSQVITSGAMVIADQASMYRGALLILELGGALLPDELLGEYVNRFQGPDFRFQTLLVSPVERPRVNWTGWSVARLKGSFGGVTIDQEDG